MSPDTQLQGMNARWAVLNEDGKIWVVRFEGRKLVRYSTEAFRKWLGGARHEASGKLLSDAWLLWEDRKKHDGLRFWPHETGEEALQLPEAPEDDEPLNLWKGFSILPRGGRRCERIEEHLFETVCGGNPEHYDYLRKWFARLVQMPGKPAETAVVLRGVEGCGKSLVGLIFRKIFGPHSLLVTSPAHVTGNFNAQLQDCVFLDVAEALFAGDRATASKLKALVTDSHLVLERKGSDPIPWPNSLSLLMTSNDEHVINAGSESRRYLVLNVSGQKRGDEKYFDSLFEEINDDSRLGVFLYDLLKEDLSNWNHRKVPETSALLEQREQSLQGIKAWALDLSGRGVVQTEKGPAPWRTFFSTSEIFFDYEDWALKQKYGAKLSRVSFGRELQKSLGLKRQKHANADQDAPAQVRMSPGYRMPKTLVEFERLVKEKAGILEEEEEAA